MRVYVAVTLIFVGALGGLMLGTACLIVGLVVWSLPLLGVGLACIAIEELSCVVVRWLYPTMQTPPTFIQHVIRARK